MTRTRSQRGMSLIELAAATITVAVSLLGTTAAIVTGAALEDSTTRTRAVARAATTLLEQVRATDFVDVVDRFDGACIPVEDAEKGLQHGEATVSVTRVDDSSSRWAVYEVRIDVRLERGQDEIVTPIVTYVSNRTEGSGLGTQDTVPADPLDTTGSTSGGTQ